MGTTQMTAVNSKLLMTSRKGRESWEASPDVVKAFPYYKMGYDMDGLEGYRGHAVTHHSSFESKH